MLAAKTTTQTAPGDSAQEETMLQLSYETRWQDRGRKAVNAVIVVVCYVIVFAGILYSLSAN